MGLDSLEIRHGFTIVVPLKAHVCVGLMGYKV